MRVLTLLVLLGLAALAQESWDTPLEIPREVRYLRAEHAELQKAVDSVRRELAPGYQGPEQLFDKFVLIGPFLWERLRKDGRFTSGDGAPMTIQPYAVEGRMVRNAAGLKALEEVMRRDLGSSFTVRRPTARELSIYWALTPDDIQEPIFVLEGGGHKFLLHWIQGHVFMVDDYQGASFERLEGMAPPMPLVMKPPGGWSAFPAEPGPRVLQALILLTEDRVMQQRVKVHELTDYLKRLETVLAGAPAAEVIVQVELFPSRAPSILIATRPQVDTAALQRKLLAVRPCPVTGRIAFQLHARPKP